MPAIVAVGDSEQREAPHDAHEPIVLSDADDTRSLRLVQALKDPCIVLAPRRSEGATPQEFVVNAANEAAALMIGRPLDDIVDHEFTSIAAVRLGPELPNACAHVWDSDTQESLQIQVPAGTAEGARYFDAAICRFEGQIVCEMHDVTDAVRTNEHLAQVAEISTDVILEVDANATITWVTDQVEAVLGWTPDEWIGETLLDYVVDEDKATAKANRTKVLAGGRADRLELRIRTRSNAPRTMMLSARARPGGRGALICLTDLDELVSTRTAHQTLTKQYELVVENTSDVVIRTDLDMRIDWASPSITTLTGMDVLDITGTRVAELLTAASVREFAHLAAQVISGASARMSLQVRTATAPRWVEMHAVPIVEDDAQVVGTIIGLRDVDAEQQARLALAAKEEQFRLAMECAPVGMAVVDLDRRFVAVNSRLCEVVGQDADWMMTHRVADLFDRAEDDQDLRTRAELLSGINSSATIECALRRPDGRRIWIEHSIAVVRDEQGVAQSYVSTVVDTTSMRKAVDELEFRAGHDALTGLHNRHALAQRTEALSSSARGRDRFAALYVDVDHLKEINDKFGHAAGDTVLGAIARRIETVCRTDDFVCRLGGDEFAVLLGDLHDDEQATRVAHAILERVAAPIVIDDAHVNVGASIGVALSERGEHATAVLGHADQALYQAKHAGRGQVVVYRADDSE